MLHVVERCLVLLLASCHNIAQLGYLQFFVYCGNRFFNKFLAVEADRVGILVIDASPKFLKLLLHEVVVELVVGRCRLAAIINHILQYARVVDALNKPHYRFAHGLQLIFQRQQGFFGTSLAEYFRYLSFLGDIVLRAQLKVDILCVILRDGVLRSIIAGHDFTSEEVNVCLCRTVVEVLLDVALQVSHKGCISFAGYDGKSVYLMHLFRKCVVVLAHTISVYAQTQATAHLLTLLRNAVRLAKRTYLEHVGIVPTFTER